MVNVININNPIMNANIDNAIIDNFVVNENNQKQHIIKMFLERDVAEKTREGYEYDIKQFFKVTNIEDITLEDIINVSPVDAEEYKNKLIESGVMRGTVRTKINHLKALFQYIHDKCIDNSKGIKLLAGNPFASVEVKTQGKNIKNASTMYGSLGLDEVRKLIDIAPKPFDLLYEMAVRTGVRKSALLKLTLNDIQKIKGRYCIIVEWDKTKGNITEAITDEMYKKACQYANKDGKIFDICESTVNNQFKRDLLAIGFTEKDIKKRHLVFHSLKKTCVGLAAVYSDNDLIIMQNKAKHTDINFTRKVYDKREYDPNLDIGLKYELDNINYDEELKNELNNIDENKLKNLIMNMDDDFKKVILEMIKRNKKVQNVY